MKFLAQCLIEGECFHTHLLMLIPALSLAQGIGFIGGNWAAR